MTTLKDNAVETAFGSRVIYPSSFAPRERHAPIADLSPSKRSALVACFKAGGLNRKTELGMEHQVASHIRHYDRRSRARWNADSDHK